MNRKVYMENERHVVVESPDGNIFIGVNPDIEAPPVIEPQPQQRPHMQIYVVYQEVTRVVLWVFVWFGMYGLVARRSVIDILNITFLAATLYSVHSEKIESRPFVMLHAFYCFGLVPIAAVLDLWWDIGYLFALGIHLLITIYWSKLDIREIN